MPTELGSIQLDFGTKLSEYNIIVCGGVERLPNVSHLIQLIRPTNNAFREQKTSD
jgi:hypothetical protein